MCKEMQRAGLPPGWDRATMRSKANSCRSQVWTPSWHAEKAHSCCCCGRYDLVQMQRRDWAACLSRISLQRTLQQRRWRNKACTNQSCLSISEQGGMSLHASWWTFAMQSITECERDMVWVWKNAYELHIHFLRDTKVWMIVTELLSCSKGYCIISTFVLYHSQCLPCWKSTLLSDVICAILCWMLFVCIGLSCISLILSILVINSVGIIINTCNCMF